MDIVAVLTKVVQAQKSELEKQHRLLDDKSALLAQQQEIMAALARKAEQLSADVKRMKSERR
jgi:hypothetical protein